MNEADKAVIRALAKARDEIAIIKDYIERAKDLLAEYERSEKILSERVQGMIEREEQKANYENGGE